MPGLVPGIHVFAAVREGVDGRDKPGHDAERTKLPQLEQRLQEVAHCLARFLRGRGIAADMRIELDTGVLVSEWR
jgi:hypothetical protein